MNLNDWLIRKDVIDYFKISLSTYKRWRKNKILVGVRKGGIILYHINEIKKIVSTLKEY